MRPFILHVDHPQQPTKSALVMGPESDPNKVALEYANVKSSFEHSFGPGFLLYFNGRGEPAIAQVSRKPAVKDESIKKGPTK
jgi:hypothetical protein